ncbi:MAG: hypothetical protein Q8936_19950 [Bacillota bacterium]|nr:hypothetical protein [Bacillota bacterium]
MPTGVTGAIEGMPGPAPGTTVQGVPGSTAVPPMGITGAGGTATAGMCGPAGCGSPFETAPGAPIQLDINYTQGYLRTQIGKLMRVEFLVGTTTLTDRTGVLVAVGISYIILRDVGSNNLIVCDIYSIKFVTIYATPR